jgi:hypothetical protein
VPTRPLPENPNLDHLRGQARALQRAVRSGDPIATARVEVLQLESGPTFPLSAAQLVVAREYGFPSWTRLRRYLGVVADIGWSAEPEVPDEDPADAFCRRVCLTYTSADAPARWLVDPPTRPHIWSAAAAADLSTVDSLLAADPGLATRRGGPHGWRPLAYLTYSRHRGQADEASLTIARRLLAAGADPNEGYLWHGLPYPFTLLTGVFGEGEQGPIRQPRHPRSRELGRLLLTAGAEPNDPQTLYNRMFNADDDHLELLFTHGLGEGDGGVWRARVGELLADPAAMLRDLLRWAVQHGQSHRIRLLARHGVDVVSPYPDGRTPWELARLAGDPALADVLVEAGAQPSTMDDVSQVVDAVLRVDRAALARLRAGAPDVVGRARAARPASSSGPRRPPASRRSRSRSSWAGT